MALAGEGSDEEECAGAAGTGVVPFANSREKMGGRSVWGGGAAPRAGLLSGGGDSGCRAVAAATAAAAAVAVAGAR